MNQKLKTQKNKLIVNEIYSSQKKIERKRETNNNSNINLFGYI